VILEKKSFKGKVYAGRQTTDTGCRTPDGRWSLELTWAFGSGELIKRRVEHHLIEKIVRATTPQKYAHVLVC